MQLREYRISNKKTLSEIADDLEVSKDVYMSWEYKKRIPTKENMQKIIAYTKGEVTANDFYGVEE